MEQDAARIRTCHLRKAQQAPFFVGDDNVELTGEGVSKVESPQELYSLHQ